MRVPASFNGDSMQGKCMHFFKNCFPCRELTHPRAEKQEHCTTKGIFTRTDKKMRKGVRGGVRRKTEFNNSVIADQ